jgi:crotonyl-CoA reductase
MLVGRHAAQMKQGDSCSCGAPPGGIGAYGIQLVLNGGGTPVGVVSSPERVKLLEAMGCENVIDRAAEGYQFWKDEHTQDEGEWRRLGKKVRGLIGEDPSIVFEHPGARPSARRCSSPSAAAPSSPARPPPASCSSTTTATSG